MPARLSVRGRDLSPFRVCGLAGLGLATAVALSLSPARGLSIAAQLGLILTAILVFLGLTLATSAVTGRETLIYYHHEIAVLASVAVVAAVLGLPVLSHLDVTALGLGAFLCLGRVGCLLVGCCHGRPAARGVRYGPAHVEQGFPAYLAGVTLLPVQAVETVGVALLVIGCAFAVPTTPGAAFGAYVTGYALLRFGLEELRGDPVRHYWHGLSEAQWTSLGVVAAMTVLAALGVVPGLPEHVGAIAALIIAAAFVAHRSNRAMLHPRHVRELATGLPVARPGRPRVLTTSLGVRVSAGATGGVSHYTLSRSESPLFGEQAAELARVLAWLSGVVGSVRVVPGAVGAYHVLIGTPDAADPATEHGKVRAPDAS